MRPYAPANTVIEAPSYLPWTRPATVVIAITSP